MLEIADKKSQENEVYPNRNQVKKKLFVTEDSAAENIFHNLTTLCESERYKKCVNILLINSNHLLSDYKPYNRMRYMIFFYFFSECNEEHIKTVISKTRNYVQNSDENYIEM